MNCIFLTGFMGSGKTTIGKELGKKLSRKVVDTDQWIEEKEGQTISEIFKNQGEEAFRKKETEALMAVTNDKWIVTTGGGVVTKEENRKWMKENGIVIFLSCEPEEIYRRLLHDTSRPLLAQNKQKVIFDLYEKRLPFYKEATLIVDTTGKTIVEVVKEIAWSLAVFK